MLVQADTQGGLAWLINQAQSDGSYSTETDLATHFQATAASWQTLSTLGETPQTQASMTDALGFVNTESFPSTENLANTLLIRALANESTDELVTELVSRLQEDGGLGDLAGYQRTELDTVFALEALATAHVLEANRDKFFATIDYLLKSPLFNSNGQISNTASTYVTALTMHALWQYRHDVSNIPSLDINGFLDKAKTYLLTQLSQETHENFELALALIAIAPILSNLDETSSYVDLLNMAQLDNGSWDNDVYTTALALRALKLTDNTSSDIVDGNPNNPSNPDLPILKGVVMDSTTNTPLSNVEIKLISGENIQLWTTDEEGGFEIQDLQYLDGELSFIIDGFVALNLPLGVKSGEVFDLGQVRLRPEIGEPLLPDLIVETMFFQIPMDAQSLVVSGDISADVKNIGTVSTSQNISLIAFHDKNQDNIYQADSDDILLGEETIEQNLASDETLSININVEGQLPFRDAPITVLLDSRQVIAELKEDNNSGTTSQDCEVNNISFDLVEMFSLSGGEIIHTPIVAPLQDTNSDGIINQDDTPMVILNSGRSEDHSGYLTAYYGDAGKQLWISGGTARGTVPAVGDINADGKPEIITFQGGYTSHVVALDNNGKELWKSTETIYTASTGITLADLDGDGQAEILAGYLVLDSQGNLLWKMDGYNDVSRGSHQIPIVADLDLDGSPEVIRNLYAYKINEQKQGELYWSVEDLVDRPVDLGYTVTGQFDDDPYPEVVTVLFGRVYLFEHDGTLKWGPVKFVNQNAGPKKFWDNHQKPGNAPLIADLDNDGYMNIGVMCRGRDNEGYLRSYYQVFDHNGTLQWFDDSIYDGSTATSSSAFDFNGDGQLEIAYHGEYNFYIFDGSNGNVLAKTPNRSLTWIENPTIVDVNNDGHANVLFSGFDGVRVFQNKENSWMPARNIWNQHAYSITNINDDLSIPRVQPNSENVHQQKQLGTLIPKGADLTAGRFLLIDNGLDNPVTLQVRIGNAGLEQSLADTPVTFYLGDPANGGVVLGSVSLDALEPNTYIDVQFDTVLSDFTQTLYAVVDEQNTLEECNEGNNSISLSVNANQSTLAQLVDHLAINGSTYKPNTSVVIDYNVENQGLFPATFQAEILIIDANGDVVATVQAPSSESLQSNETINQQAAWNTGTTLAGYYQANLRLTTTDGELITEQQQGFIIEAAAETQIKSRITTDKLTYHSTDLVQLSALIQNQTLNVLLEDAPLQITILDPNQQVIYIETREIQSLTPQGMQELLIPYMLKDAVAGTYTVELTALKADGSTLASQTTSFEVQESLELVLSGSIAMQTVSQTQQCTSTITYSGDQDITALPLQYLLLNVEQQTVIETETETVNLASDGLHTKTVEYFTHILPAAEYACVLQAQIDGEWQTLDFQVFNHDNILASECSTVYAIHDQELDTTQLFTYDLNQRLIAALGPVYPEYDLEGMDIHPHTHKLYASTGHKNAILYLVDGFTGDLMPIGLIGFDDVVALSFDATGQLWGWSKQGLITIDITTAQAQLVLASSAHVEGLAWNNDNSLLYATASDPTGKNTTLWAYDPTTSSFTVHCENLAGEIESLEVLPDDTLAFGIHNDNKLGLYAYDPAACQVVEQAKIITLFNDIEAIAWPTVDCTTQQAALRAFLSALSDESFIDENRNVRIVLEGQTYSGQLAESITQGAIPVNAELNLVAIPDANDDGLDDFLITYPDGTQQVLYYLGLSQN
ncbi:FG-GAP-like repeat-containing protein [Candidatus Albibeggiatoa sp. nov. BB20]|uniref:FG-GAP-like repeat-containing protein n=1 Tax=Candidatus Albibeggiatoa sp. nov. BB20 TaxID=3162723 RepID=UPI003365ADB0